MTLTIQEAIRTLIAAVPGSPRPETVDSVKVGDPEQPLTGIVTTFLATTEVIEAALQRNANLIIAHEPVFYNHLDQTDWLQNNPVYQAKRKLVEEHGLVIWRFHDYLHSLQPDPVMTGIIQALSWESYLKGNNFVCQIPPMKFSDLVNYVKTKLGIPTLRVIGNLEMNCQTIALLPGFPPAEYQIGLLNEPGVDVLICGEIHEWETSEYARDALHLEQHKALIVIGHAASEEPGIKAVGPWLQALLPGVSIDYIPTGKVFQYL